MRFTSINTYTSWLLFIYLFSSMEGTCLLPLTRGPPNRHFKTIKYFTALLQFTGPHLSPHSLLRNK